MNRLLSFCVCGLLLLPLFACGGGGGGSDYYPSAALTGNVTDSTQEPVENATVEVYDPQTQTTIATTKTDAAGNYRIVFLPYNKALTIKARGGAGNFPAQVEGVKLTLGVTTVLDVYLPSTTPAVEADTDLWKSQAVLNGPLHGFVDLSASTLSAVPTEVYIAPADVSRFGNGFADYSVSPLPLQIGLEINELFAACAFEIFAGSDPVTFNTVDLYLPVPASLYNAAAAASDTEVYRFDESTFSWVLETYNSTLGTYNSILTTNADGDNAFKVIVTQPGLYRVGAMTSAVEVTGTAVFEDGIIPAGGTVLYVTGSDYGYQQVVTVASDGTYSALVKAGGTTDYEFVTWGYGVQLYNSTDVVATPDVVLSWSKPTPGVPAAALIELDELELQSPPSIGLITASGRLIDDQDLIDGVLGKADVSFNANSFDGNLTLNATTGEATLQALPGQTFETLFFAPTIVDEGFVDLSVATLPLLVVVQTGDGHFAKISIDSVNSTGGGLWEVTFRSAFSLTGSFF